MNQKPGYVGGRAVAVKPRARSRAEQRRCRSCFRISPNPAQKVSRKMQLNSLLSPTRRRCLFGSSAAM
ncbi:unnamed protein product [Brassica napus]|uniref:(rape) hypothetical protein n=1 Tax=Brassica napus TaxID=3708 RepID=A0A816SRF4_BRANA|nr:unnamed protein product [Brassica napus]